MKKLYTKIQKVFLPMLLSLMLGMGGLLGNPLYVQATSEQSFQVPIQLRRADDPGSLSMGNQGLVQTATVIESESGAAIYLQLVGIDLQGMSGHLTKLYHYENGSLFDSGVTETVEDYGLDGELDTFISGVVLERSQLREESIKIRVQVDAMDSIMGGEGLGEQDAILVLDYSGAPAPLSTQTKPEAEETKSEEKTEKKEEKKEASKEEKEVKSEAEKEVLKEEKKEEQPKKEAKDYFKKLDLGNGKYLIDVSGKYINPLTGEIDDGGKNASVGEGMVDGVLAPLDKEYIEDGNERFHKALLKKTNQGYFATIRLYQMNFIQNDGKQGPTFFVLGENGEFNKVEAKMTQEGGDADNKFIDFRIPVSSPTFLAKVEMFVAPMNRNVTFFIESDIRNLEEGTGDFKVAEADDFNLTWIIGGGVSIVILGALVISTLMAYKKMKRNEG